MTFIEPNTTFTYSIQSNSQFVANWSCDSEDEMHTIQCTSTNRYSENCTSSMQINSVGTAVAVTFVSFAVQFGFVCYSCQFFVVVFPQRIETWCGSVT